MQREITDEQGGFAALLAKSDANGNRARAKGLELVKNEKNGFAADVQSRRLDLVYLVRAKEKPTNRDAWYFVQVRNALLLPIFLEKVKTGLDITDYGEVLYSGWGSEPGPEVREMVQKRFG